VFKICFIGDKQVGKTAVILSLTEEADKQPLGHETSNELDRRIIEETKSNRMRSGSLQSPDIVSRIFKLPIS
jgi:GTPase SAR1 family protein